MIELRCGGQTGVDLGAALTALDIGVPIGGFMPADGRNEDGTIPERVATHLTRHDRTNPAARTRANVATADAALVIVRDRRRAGETRGTALTIGLCEERRTREWFPLVVADPRWPEESVRLWATWTLRGLSELDRGRALKLLLVAGPRASLWPEGERQAARFVRAVLEACRG